MPSSFTPEVDVVDTRTYRVVARVPQASPFSPNLAVSRDGTEVWFTLKDSGKVQVMSARPPFRIFATLATGPITNHVTLVENAHGKFAYVTVGGENQVKVYIAASGLQPGQAYQLWLVASPTPPYGEKQPLATFTTNVSGAQIAQAIGPLRQVVAAGDGAAAGGERRFLLVTKANSDEPALTQEPGGVASRP